MYSVYFSFVVLVLLLLLILVYSKGMLKLYEFYDRPTAP